MMRVTLVVAVVSAMLTCAAPAQTRPGDILTDHCLVISPIGAGGRSPTFTDPIEAQIVAGTFKVPKESDELPRTDRPGAPLVWKKLTAKEPGVFEGDSLGRGYAFVEVDCDSERVMILHAQGHSMVYVNGEPRAGDPYSYGYVHLPVLLHKGS